MKRKERREGRRRVREKKREGEEKRLKTTEFREQRVEKK